MKFSLTLILTCLIVFISSCSISPRQDFVKPDINLKIETSNKNKEIIKNLGKKLNQALAGKLQELSEYQSIFFKKIS